MGGYHNAPINDQADVYKSLVEWMKDNGEFFAMSADGVSKSMGA